MYSRLCLDGSEININQIIIEITFQSRWHGHTKHDHTEYGDFQISKRFHMEDWPNTSAWKGEGYDLWLDRGCIAVQGSNVGLAQTIYAEHPDYKRQWRESDFRVYWLLT